MSRIYFLMEKKIHLKKSLPGIFLNSFFVGFPIRESFLDKLNLGFKIAASQTISVEKKKKNSSKMLLKIDKFFYYQFKEIVNNRYNRWYRLKHSSEILSLSIWLFRMLLAIASKKNILFNDDDDDNGSSDGGKYCRMDPFCYYRYKSNEIFFLHSIMFTLMITLMGILGKWIFFFCRIDSTAIDWPYKYLIKNLDDYEQSKRSLVEIQSIKRNIWKKNLQKFQQQKKIFPLFFRKFFCIILTKYSIWKQKHSIELDQVKWSKIERIDIPQTITNNDRLKIIRFLQIIDPIIFIIHLLLSKFIFRKNLQKKITKIYKFQ